jgi:hypothetical protein
MEHTRRLPFALISEVDKENSQLPVAADFIMVK